VDVSVDCFPFADCRYGIGIEFIIWQIFKTSCSDMMNRPIICFHIGIKKINAELNYRSVSFVNRLCHFPAYVVTC